MIRTALRWVLLLACIFSPLSAAIAEETISPTFIYTGHNDIIASVAFSRDGSLLASACADKTTKLWDTHSGNLLRTLPGLDVTRKQILDNSKPIDYLKLGHTNPVCSVAFHPNGKEIATGGGSAIKVWDVQTGNLIRTIIDFDSKDPREPNGKLVEALPKWDAQRGDRPVNQVKALAYSPDGKCLASADQAGCIRLWDTNTGNLLHSLIGNDGWMGQLAFSTDGSKLASSTIQTAKENIILWDVNSGRLLYKLDSYSLSNYSPAGKTITAMKYKIEDATPKYSRVILDAATGKELKVLSDFANTSSELAKGVHSPNGGLIACQRNVTGSNYLDIEIRDGVNGNLLYTLHNKDDGNTADKFNPASGNKLTDRLNHMINAMAWSSNGKEFAAGQRNGFLELWTLDSPHSTDRIEQKSKPAPNTNKGAPPFFVPPPIKESSHWN